MMVDRGRKQQTLYNKRKKQKQKKHLQRNTFTNETHICYHFPK